MSNHKTPFPIVAEIFDAIVDAHYDMPQELFTSKTVWRAREELVEAMLRYHGWTVEEFDKAICDAADLALAASKHE